MRPGSQPVFPFPRGQLQFTGLSVRDLARITALHGLLVSGTDLSPEAAAEYAQRAAETLYPMPTEPEKAVNVTDRIEEMAEEAEANRAKPRGFWSRW